MRIQKHLKYVSHNTINKPSTFKVKSRFATQKKVFSVIFLTFLYSQLLAQAPLKVLKTSTKDSLNFYVEQQKERLKKHPEYHVDSMMQAGLIVYMRGEIVHARTFFEMANQKHRETGHLQGVARSNANIAALYEIEGKYEKALKCYQESLKIMDSLKNILSDYEVYTTQCKIYGNIGILYNEMKEFNQSYPYIQKAIELDKFIIKMCNDSLEMPKYQQQKTISETGIASSYNNLAFYWDNKTNPNLDSALYYYQKAYNIYLQNNSPYQYHSYANMGVVYGQKGEYNKALPILEKSYEGAIKNKHEISLSAVYQSLAKTYTQTKNYSKAHLILTEGLQYSRDNHRLADELGLLNTLFNLQTAEGNYKIANRTSQKMILLRDSLLSQKKNEAIAKLEVSYNTQLKEYEAKLAKEELKTKEALFNHQKSWFLVSSLTVLLIITIIIFLIWRSKIRESQKRVVLENKLIRSQINPHFMFNALGAIQSYMIDHTNEDTMKYLFRFSQLMRNILDCLRSPTISISKEIDIISDYLMLQKLRFEEDFDFSIEVDDKLDKNIEIPPMLLQPFVENAVEHGVRSIHNEKQGNIQVNFAMQNKKTLIMSVEDNGKGFDINTIPDKKGHISHASNIIKEYIVFLKKMMNRNIHLDIDSTLQKGTKVSIKIDIR